MGVALVASAHSQHRGIRPEHALRYE